MPSPQMLQATSEALAESEHPEIPPAVLEKLSADVSSMYKHTCTTLTVYFA